MKEYIVSINANGWIKAVKNELVRCKDCKFEEVCCRRSSNDPNWFCADGQRRDED